ncbi:hypothetical protein N9383_05175 [Granulosicoccus sp.]|nr:hypothetical protein [Granulosicoccus sp.]
MQTNPIHASESPQLRTLSREAFWQRRVTQWRDLGLSKMAYCQQYSLVYHQMVYWCTKAANVDEKPQSNNFVPVAAAPAVDTSAGLSVHLPGDIAIVGIDERSITLVGKLLEQL